MSDLDYSQFKNSPMFDVSEEIKRVKTEEEKKTLKKRKKDHLKNKIKSKKARKRIYKKNNE